MTINPTRFECYNVADTCAVWNLLSSSLLYRTAERAGCQYCITGFVLYECLYKQRTRPSPQELELMERLRKEREKGRFLDYTLDIDDLQDLEVLECRRRLGRGELASMVWARKTRQAFLTDDQRARRLASQVMDEYKVQTTPQLFGWLVFTGKLTDADKGVVAAEHRQFAGLLTAYFEVMYHEALRCRLMNSSSS